MSGGRGFVLPEWMSKARDFLERLEAFRDRPRQRAEAKAIAQEAIATIEDLMKLQQERYNEGFESGKRVMAERLTERLMGEPPPAPSYNSIEGGTR